MPYAKLFRSRWSALFWAAGILWLAVDVAGYAPASKPEPTANTSASTDAADTDATAEAKSDIDILAGMVNGN
ncbi:MAG: hypothetical protein ABI240_03130 [Sphingomonas sp.]